MKLVRYSFLMITLLLCSLAAKAHDFEVGGIFYNITSSTDMTVAVTFKGSSYSSYSGEYSGDVVIPSTVTYNSETYSVVEIDGLTFYQCTSVTSVNIPDGVTSIGNSAFLYCSSLTSITLLSSLTIIGETAFYGCSNLTKVNIPQKVTYINSYTFYSCSSLTEITIPNSVRSVGPNTFVNCTSLKNS